MTPTSREQSGAGVVVVGAGHAGVQLVDSLRSLGYAGPLALVSAEAVRPYQRPPLSKDYLQPGGGPEQALPLRGPDFFGDLDVDARWGVRTCEVDRARHLVHTDDGRQLRYASLVLATGARNRRLEVPGMHLDGIVSLRTLADAEDLGRRLESTRRVVVVGAGFIGLEVAASLYQHGMDVTVLEIDRLPMARAVSSPTAEFFAAAHTASGITLLLQETVVAFVGHGGRLTHVRTASGVEHPADLAVVGIGVLPNTELACAAGLAVEDGIVVDGQLRTCDPDVYAIGDCAAFPSRHAGRRTRLESVQNATDHARHVAAVLVHGTDGAYEQLPWFWSNQGRLRLQIAGLKPDHAHTVVRGDPAKGSFSVFGFRADVLHRVESVNVPADHMAARRMLSSDVGLTPSQAGDPAFDLKAHSRAVVPAAW